MLWGRVPSVTSRREGRTFPRSPAAWQAPTGVVRFWRHSGGASGPFRYVAPRCASGAHHDRSDGGPETRGGLPPPAADRMNKDRTRVMNIRWNAFFLLNTGKRSDAVPGRRDSNSPRQGPASCHEQAGNIGKRQRLNDAERRAPGGRAIPGQKGTDAGDADRLLRQCVLNGQFPRREPMARGEIWKAKCRQRGQVEGSWGQGPSWSGAITGVTFPAVCWEST
jgi:hypothetical protein